MKIKSYETNRGRIDLITENVGYGIYLDDRLLVKCTDLISALQQFNDLLN